MRKKPSLNEYIAKKWCCFSKKLIFDMKNWFSDKKNLIFGFPVISSLMLKKNFIENGRKMTKLEAFFERPSLIEQPNALKYIHRLFKTLNLQDMQTLNYINKYYLIKISLLRYSRRLHHSSSTLSWLHLSWPPVSRFSVE